jgi:hypothetical protein
MFGNFPFSILWTPLFRNLYLLYSDSLYVRTHLFCIGQNFPLLYFYIVAPIEEDMLLGLDFLEANGVSLHLKEKELQIAGDVIPMSLGTGSPY